MGATVLILTRQTNQSIVINGNIVVTVLEMSGDHVRLGINAPREVSVHREEVQREIVEQNRLAASGTDLVDGDTTGLPRP